MTDLILNELCEDLADFRDRLYSMVTGSPGTPIYNCERTQIFDRAIVAITTLREQRNMCELLDKALTAQMITWYPITESEPTPYEVVLVTAKMKEHQEALVYMASRQSGRWDLLGVKNSEDYEVTAFMPLPPAFDSPEGSAREAE